ncbi:MAG TPA: RES family NAD+ phosphorylase [Gemmatimonadaceae bacterium]|nr:RES family NAD+ phosphorylase [Gemmatimonadaceae bacterium]
MLRDSEECVGLTWVGRPLDLVRALDPVYLDQARADWPSYVATTLRFSQLAGGRYNPPGEFGALYTTNDDATAWEELAGRFRREGIPALPPEMGMLGILVTVGRYADLTDAATRTLWDADTGALAARSPTADERESCWTLARAVRAEGDFLQAPSARADGMNVPLYPDRERGTLRMELRFARRAVVPEHLRQRARESW